MEKFWGIKSFWKTPKTAWIKEAIHCTDDLEGPGLSKSMQWLEQSNTVVCYFLLGYSKISVIKNSKETQLSDKKKVPLKKNLSRSCCTGFQGFS